MESTSLPPRPRPCPGPPGPNPCPDGAEKLPWSGYCDNCRRVVVRKSNRKRYREKMAAEGKTVVPRVTDDELGPTPLPRATRPPEGPPRLAVEQAEDTSEIITHDEWLRRHGAAVLNVPIHETQSTVPTEEWHGDEYMPLRLGPPGADKGDQGRRQTPAPLDNEPEVPAYRKDWGLPGDWSDAQWDEYMAKEGNDVMNRIPGPDD